MKGTSKKINPGNKSKNELRHAANSAGGTGYGGGSSPGGKATKNEMVTPASRPAGLGYGKK